MSGMNTHAQRGIYYKQKIKTGGTAVFVQFLFLQDNLDNHSYNDIVNVCKIIVMGCCFIKFISRVNMKYNLLETKLEVLDLSANKEYKDILQTNWF